MKKVLSLAICLLLTLSLAACGNNSQTAGRTNNQQQGVNDVLEAGMAEADKANDDSVAQSATTDIYDEAARQNGLNENAPAPVTDNPTDVALSSTEGIDIDLTTLSSTMVYSEVYNMMANPEDYAGKVIKMNGLAASYHDEASGNYYFACIIKDATACCAQGIEYVLTDEYICPDDYPGDNEDITVIGIFDTYMEGDYMYCTLREAKLL